MNNDTVKFLLKKIRANETRMSVVMGILAIAATLYVVYPYFRRAANEQTPIVSATPTPLVVFESLPGTVDLNILPVQYVVKKGDSTWKIAEAFYGSGSNYVDIEKENSLTSDQQLTEGMTLTIPKAVVKASEGQGVAPQVSATPVASEAPVASQAPVLASPSPLPEKSAGGIQYTTTETDTLWKLAQKFYGDGKQWTKIYEANKAVVRNPNTLGSGIVLLIP